MKDPESILRVARLTIPSPDLDRRLDAAFAAAAVTQPPQPTRFWRWTTAMAAAAAIVAFSRPRSTPSAEVVAAVRCEVDTSNAMRSLLLDLPSRDQARPHFSVSVSTQ